MSALDELGPGAAVAVPDVIGRAAAGEVRTRLERAGYARYALIDRGSYEHAAADEPEVCAAVARIASELTGRALVAVEARALRLGPGDYLLAHHDRVHAGRPVEAVLDLSAAAVPGAEVHYRRRGGVFFRFAGAPGALAVVERGATITCNHTYVSKRHAGASVVRLVVLLRDAPG